jgi:hypothetical protein
MDGSLSGPAFDEYGNPIVETPCSSGPNQGDPGATSYPPGTGLFPGGEPGSPGGTCE